MDLDIMLAAGLVQQVSEAVAVIVIDEDGAAIHSALGHVQGIAGSSRRGVRGIGAIGWGTSAQRAVVTAVFAVGKRWAVGSELI